MQPQRAVTALCDHVEEPIQSKFLVHEVCVKCTNQCMAKPATPVPFGLPRLSRAGVETIC